MATASQTGAKPAAKKATAPRTSAAEASEGVKPPKTVASAAKRGLDLHERFGRGGTEVGVQRAKDLMAQKPVPPADVRHIASYFARHAVDKDAPGFSDKANPSAGYIAWQLWGGDAGEAWAKREAAKLDKAET